MGCWEFLVVRDNEPDFMDEIRKNLPKDGRLELGKIIDMLLEEGGVPPVQDAPSYSGPITLAEILVKFLDQEVNDLDERGIASDNKFSAMTSFTASRESVQWLCDYLSDTIRYAKKNARVKAQDGDRFNGWFMKKDWIGWLAHLKTLVIRLDTVLASHTEQIDLLPPQEQQADQKFC